MDFSNGWLVKQRRIRVVFPLLGPKDFKFACSPPTPPPCHEDGCRVVKDNICQMMRLHSCKKGSITFTWPTTRRPCRRHSTITRLSIMVQFHPIPVQSCTLSFRTANTTSSDRLLLLHVHPSISETGRNGTQDNTTHHRRRDDASCCRVTKRKRDAWLAVAGKSELSLSANRPFCPMGHDQI